MCGIFGYTGKRRDAANVILEGLKGLEYRGYDSWGIAIKVGDSIKSEKHIGKIGAAETSLPESSIGIGHTRWATHGGVTVENAHPHSDCKKQVAVLHNGIVENFQELKEELQKNGHRFVSETDTEVIAHLIEEHLKTKDFISSVREAFNLLKGLNAIVALYTKSSQIIAAKNGSPLILGVGKDELFVASDASEIVKHTKQVIFLEDKQMAVLDQKITLYSLPEGSEIKPKIHTLDWEFEKAEKGDFKHFILKEIYEQPRVIENIALNRRDEINRLAQMIDEAQGTFLLGCGTASYAALASVYLFSSVAKKHVNFSIGSEFKYLEDYLTPNSLLVPISQSGETIDVVDPVGKARKKSVKVAAITNVLGSTLYRQADFKFLLNAGVEKAVIATKSFIAMVSVLLLTAYTLAGKQTEGIEILKNASINISQILSDNTLKQIKTLAQTLAKKEHIYVLGRGISYAAALEASLKLKETAYAHAEGFAGGELKHGPIALIEKGTPCIIFAPNDETYSAIMSNAMEIKARGGTIIGISYKNSDVFDEFIQTADIKEGAIIPQIVISQLLAYELALAKGITDPDKPRNLAKSVTVK